LERNAARDRTVPIDIVKRSHAEIQQNMGKLQRLFGMKNFIVIDNNNANEKILDKVYKKVRQIVKQPVKSHIAKMWMRKELERKQAISENAPNTADAMKRYKAGKAGFTDKAHLKAKGLIPRADGTKRKSDKYK
jgi:tetrahydrodipicolinate N-succinyltransferase